MKALIVILLVVGFTALDIQMVRAIWRFYHPKGRP
jgi:hypothetical protein